MAITILNGLLGHAELAVGGEMHILTRFSILAHLVLVAELAPITSIYSSLMPLITIHTPEPTFPLVMPMGKRGSYFLFRTVPAWSRNFSYGERFLLVLYLRLCLLLAP
jgi:hypothetical protein